MGKGNKGYKGNRGFVPSTLAEEPRHRNPCLFCSPCVFCYLHGMRLPAIPRGPNLWSSAPVAALLIAIAAFLAVSSVRIVRRAIGIQRERATLDARIRELQAERERLRQAIASLGSPEAVERLAKERLNLKRPGEEVVVVTPPAKPAPSEASRFSRFIPSWLHELFGFLGR